jgi:hypothetical protein
MAAAGAVMLGTKPSLAGLFAASASAAGAAAGASSLLSQQTPALPLGDAEAFDRQRLTCHGVQDPRRIAMVFSSSSKRERSEFSRSVVAYFRENNIFTYILQHFAGDSTQIVTCTSQGRQPWLHTPSQLSLQMQLSQMPT